MSANQNLSQQPLQDGLQSAVPTPNQSIGITPVNKANALPLCWGHRGVSDLNFPHFHPFNQLLQEF
jgi:hypothetical protein